MPFIAGCSERKVTVMFQMKMTALMILQSDFPPDLRVEKEARSLQEGFSVVLLSSNRSNSDSLYHCHRGIKVFRLPFQKIKCLEAVPDPAVPVESPLDPEKPGIDQTVQATGHACS